MQSDLKIIECPRDAMQGIHDFIPTAKKIKYINALLKVGFDTIDFGSFVSPKMIPQLRDTAEVYRNLDFDNTSSRLLVIVANLRGAQEAVEFSEIDILGFPFSISETFQKRNTNSSIQESLVRVEHIQELCQINNKELEVYISMGFGNPYKEPWNAEIVINWVEKLAEMDIRTIALSDTIGVSNPENISYLFSQLIPAFPQIEFGAHLHTHPHNWEEKVQAAWDSGCKRFDGAIKGFGGCPMADDVLVGNMPTENLVEFAERNQLNTGIKAEKFREALDMALFTFPV